MPKKLKQWFTSQEAARRLGMSEQALSREARKGRIHRYEYEGKGYVYKRSDLVAYARAQREKATRQLVSSGHDHMSCEKKMRELHEEAVGYEKKVLELDTEIRRLKIQVIKLKQWIGPSKEALIEHIEAQDRTISVLNRLRNER